MTNSTRSETQAKPPVLINLDGIPADLQTLRRWVVWKYALTDGKWKKPPYDAKTGEEADVTEPAMWSTFAQALAAFRSGDYDGLGFVLALADGISGIDFDGCVVDGVVDPAVLAIVRRLGSYSELSPSCTGIHVLVRGTVPGPRCRNDARGIEMYGARRYFTVSGLILEDAPNALAMRQPELDALYQELFPPETERERVEEAAVRTAQPVLLEDETLIKAMLRRPVIEALWHGDLSAYGDSDQPSGDHSRADLALCSHLAFYTGRDAERMDRLFRKSGLYRAKWERAEYRQQTIARAIQSCTNVYDPGYYLQDNSPVSPAEDGEMGIEDAVEVLAEFGLSGDFGRSMVAVGCARWLPIQQTYMALLTLARRNRRLSVSPGLHGLAHEAALGKSSVRRHLDVLQAAGLIALDLDDHLTITLIVAQRDKGSPPPTCDRLNVPLRYDYECYLDHLQDDAFARPHHAHTRRRAEVDLAIEKGYGAAGRLVVGVLVRQDATRAQMVAATGAGVASIRDATIQLEHDGLILVAGIVGRTGRTKIYTLHPDFNERLDALRPRLRTAGLGQMRTYRSQRVRADYFDREVEMMKCLEEPDLKVLGKLIAKRDRADRAALAAFEALRAMGIDPRRRLAQSPDEAYERVPLSPLIDRVEQEMKTAKDDLTALCQLALIRFYLILCHLERLLALNHFDLYKRACETYDLGWSFSDWNDLRVGMQQAPEANA